MVPWDKNKSRRMVLDPGKAREPRKKRNLALNCFFPRQPNLRGLFKFLFADSSKVLFDIKSWMDQMKFSSHRINVHVCGIRDLSSVFQVGPDTNSIRMARVSLVPHSLLKPVWQTIFRIRHSVEVELLHNQSTASKEWVRGFEKPLTAKPRVKQIIRIPNEGENKNV